MKRIAQIAVATSAALLAASGAFAQGCAMCYSQASAAGAHAQKSLDWGIFILLIPSLILFGGVFAMLMRNARQME